MVFVESDAFALTELLSEMHEPTAGAARSASGSLSGGHPVAGGGRKMALLPENPPAEHVMIAVAVAESPPEIPARSMEFE